MENTCIVACGKSFDIGTRVVLWNEPGGFNGHDNSTYTWKETNRKTGKEIVHKVSGYRISKRTWRRQLTVAQLQGVVTQFFLHHSGMYHAAGTFNVLHNERGLSCHFILDDDGTIYQTVDLMWKAWHGGSNNPMSVGVEIDSRAYASKFPTAYDEYHQKRYNVGPRRKRKTRVQGMNIWGYEYNDAQYKALIKLGMGMMKLFPIIGTNPDFPRDANGEIETKIIKNPKKHLGFICHFHNSTNKTDPIAFDFERFLKGVKTENADQPSSWFTPGEEPQEDDSPAKFTVAELQKALADLGYNPGVIDGIMGRNTKGAIRAFQAANGLTVDGIAGPNTKKKLRHVLRSR